MSQVPVEVPVSPASQAEFEWLADNIRQFYEIRGISQMTANAQKPSGVTAAVAMQTLNDIQTVRFLPKARGYETSFVTMGHLMVQAARDIADEHGGYLVEVARETLHQRAGLVRRLARRGHVLDPRRRGLAVLCATPRRSSRWRRSSGAPGTFRAPPTSTWWASPISEAMLTEQTSEREFIQRAHAGRYLDATDARSEARRGRRLRSSGAVFISDKPSAMALCVSTYWEAKRDPSARILPLERASAYSSSNSTSSWRPPRPRRPLASNPAAPPMMAPNAAPPQDWPPCRSPP